jgi:hypothetical protein
MRQFKWQRRLRKRIIAESTKLLTKPLNNYVLRVPNNIDGLKRQLRKGDILLVEGDQRISQVIRYLTQSCWSHCALYIGDTLLKGNPERARTLRELYGDDANHLLIEAVEGDGVTVCPLSKYRRYNIRLCRPQGLSKHDAEIVIKYAISRLGHRYDLRHIVDLARYFLPVSFVPRRWRWAALTLGRESQSAVICSTMIATGLSLVGYPILPQVELDGNGTPPKVWQRLVARKWQHQQHQIARFRRRDPALITPRDFDLSPYFQIIKFNHLADAKFDYRQIVWEELDSEPSRGNGQSSTSAG